MTATPFHFLRPQPRPAKPFEPRSLRPIAPFADAVATARSVVRAIEAELGNVADKLVRARSDQAAIEQKRQLVGAVEAEIRQCDAAAYLDGGTADTAALAKQLTVLKREVRRAETNDIVVADAILVMRRRQAELSAQLPGAKAALEAEQRQYLRGRREVVFEKLRGELHDLQGTLAQALAIERHVHFNGGEATARFLENLPGAFERDPPFRPDWVGSQGSQFPGYAEAVEALAAELATAGEESINA